MARETRAGHDVLLFHHLQSQASACGARSACVFFFASSALSLALRLSLARCATSMQWLELKRNARCVGLALARMGLQARPSVNAFLRGFCVVRPCAQWSRVEERTRIQASQQLPLLPCCCSCCRFFANCVLQLFVKSINGKTRTVTVQPTDTIRQIKVTLLPCC